jgi:hypothetical protein
LLYLLSICRYEVVICYFFICISGQIHCEQDYLNMINFFMSNLYESCTARLNNTEPSLLKGIRGSYFRYAILFTVKSFKFYCIYKLEDPCCCSRNLRWHKHSPIPYQGTELFLSASPKPCNLDSIYLLEVHEA